MRRSFMLALALGVALPLEARAEECSDTSRTLGGHVFPYPASFDSAFINTSFATRTTGRYASVGNVPIGNNRVDINSFDLNQNFDFALALGERFSVGAGVYGRGVVGLNGRAIATAGVLYSYGANLSGAFRIARIEESGTQVALGGELFGVQSGGRFSLLPFINAIRDEPVRDIPAAILNFGDLLMTPISRLGGALSLNVAQAISPVFSVQASFRLNVIRIVQSPYVLEQRQRVDVASTAWSPLGGVGVGMIPTGWPTSFNAEYRIAAQNKLDPTPPARHAVVVAVYYVGRPDLQLGPLAAAEFGLPEVQGIDTNGNAQPSDRGTAISGQVVMRYFW